jgi:putative ABC transport system permease protein
MVAIYAHENWNTTVTGTSEQYFIISNRKVKSGRIFTPERCGPARRSA